MPMEVKTTTRTVRTPIIVHIACSIDRIVSVYAIQANARNATLFTRTQIKPSIHKLQSYIFLFNSFSDLAASERTSLIVSALGDGFSADAEACVCVCSLQHTIVVGLIEIAQ